MIIDVTDPPSPFSALDATGANATANTTNLRDMIDARLGAYYFPTGRYAIDDTITFPSVGGYHVIGSGKAQTQGGGGSSFQAGAELLWQGEDGGTMVEIQGTGLVWNGLTLWGRSDANQAAADVTGIKITSANGVPVQRLWFNDIMIDGCKIGILAQDSTCDIVCGFAYYWARACQMAFVLSNTSGVLCVLNQVESSNNSTTFQAIQGARLYARGITILGSGVTVLDISGGNSGNSFFELNGIKKDGGAGDVTLLNNLDVGAGDYLIRLTNFHLAQAGTEVFPRIDVNRGGGQTVVDLIGGRNVSQVDGIGFLNERVTISGASPSRPSRLIVRDCQTPSAESLIAPSSSNYSYDGLKNWTFPNGLVDDDSGP